VRALLRQAQQEASGGGAPAAGGNGKHKGHGKKGGGD
jgi:hypothetical protein